MNRSGDRSRPMGGLCGLTDSHWLVYWRVRGEIRKRVVVEVSA